MKLVVKIESVFILSWNIFLYRSSSRRRSRKIFRYFGFSYFIRCYIFYMINSDSCNLVKEAKHQPEGFFQKAVMMVNCSCIMVDRRKSLTLFYLEPGHCQKFSPQQISNTPQAGIEPAVKLSSNFFESTYAVVITTTPPHHSSLP